MATQAPVLKTPRELYRKQLREDLEVKKQKLYSGPLEGTEVVLWDDVADVLGQPMGAVSDHGAEVATPARVVVFAVCPRCGQPAPVALEVTPELRVDGSGGHLHIKGKSKPVTHTCGQLLAGMGADLDQEEFELEDIVGSGQAAVDDADDEEAGSDDAAIDDSDAPVLADDADGLPDACDWPRCALPLGHDGPHDVPKGAPRLPVDEPAGDSGDAGFDDIPF